MTDVLSHAKEVNVVSEGERVKVFRFKPPNGYYSRAEVYTRANTIRAKLEEEHPGEYAILVAVRDRTVGGWRSGKFTATHDKNIYFFTPELYDKEFNGSAAGKIELPELMAEDMRLYVRRIRTGSGKTKVKVTAKSK